MAARSYATVYRILGVPLEYDRKRLRTALISIFALSGTKHIRIHSLAPNYTLSRPSQVATVTFENDPSVLLSGKREGPFALPSEDSSGDSDDEDALDRAKITLDTRFEGLTPLRSFSDEDDHQVE
ncbi:MAG: hypothetical protein Q9157_006130 [Trypethelium eluteriae]